MKWILMRGNNKRRNVLIFLIAWIISLLEHKEEVNVVFVENKRKYENV